jgi:hypothetical protein
MWFSRASSGKAIVLDLILSFHSFQLIIFNPSKNLCFVRVCSFKERRKHTRRRKYSKKNIFSFAFWVKIKFILHYTVSVPMNSERQCPDPWHFGTDPDPRIRTVSLTNRLRILLFSSVTSRRVFLFGVTFTWYHSPQIKSHKEVTKNWKLRFFFIFLLVDGRIRIRILTKKLRIRLRIQDAQKHTNLDLGHLILHDFFLFLAYKNRYELCRTFLQHLQSQCVYFPLPYSVEFFSIEVNFRSARSPFFRG